MTFFFRVMFLTILGFLLLIPFQENEKVELNLQMPVVEFCASTMFLQKMQDENLDYQILEEQLESKIFQHFNNSNSNTTLSSTSTLYELPVVVHVIHNGGVENISDAAAEQSIQYLNDAFANVGAYNPSTGVDTEIQFCLVESDPNGLPTGGVTRTVSSLTEMSFEDDDSNVKSLISWNTLDYINIWLVKDIASTTFGDGINGYSTGPISHGSSKDGMVIEAAVFAGSAASATVIVHEMGHYLGLLHTFQGGCTNGNCLINGDKICDTPPDQSTSNLPCGTSQNSCTSDVNPSDSNNPFTSDQDDMQINYMDYANPNCLSAFTNGQTDRMQFIIEGQRSTLLNSEGCGVPCSNPITALFSVDTCRIVLEGELDFINMTTNATQYEWYYDNTELFAETINASYQFEELGFFNITLVASNDNPACTQRITKEIEVFCPVEGDFDLGVTSILLGESVFLDPQIPDSNYTFRWLVDGMSLINGVSFQYTPSEAGFFVIGLEISSSDPNCSFLVERPLEVICPTVADFVPSAVRILVNDSIDFVNVSINSEYNEWYLDENVISENIDFSYTYNEIGLFETELIAYDTSHVLGMVQVNCSSSKKVLVMVDCNTNADFFASSVEVIIGETVFFTNQGSNALGYEWSVSDVIKTSTTDFEYSFDEVGFYQVCLNASSTACDDKTCLFISVVDSSEICSYSFFKSIGIENRVQKGSTVIGMKTGNLLIGGSDGDDALLINTDDRGELIWERTFDISPSTDLITAMELDTDNRLLVVGKSGDDAIFIFKYDFELEVVLWSRKINSLESLSISNILETVWYEDYLLIGQQIVNNIPKAYFAKLNTNTGELTTSEQTYHTEGLDDFRSAIIVNDEIYIAGQGATSANAVNGGRGVLYQLNKAGQLVKATSHLIAANQNAQMQACDLVSLNDSILTLYHGSENGNTPLSDKIFLSKSGLNHEMIWAKAYQSSELINLEAISIVNAPDGHIVLGREADQSNLILLKTDRNGNLIWSKKYGGVEGLELITRSKALRYLNNSIYIVASENAGSEDIVLMKINPDGSIVNDCIFASDFEMEEVEDLISFTENFEPTIELVDHLHAENTIVSEAADLRGITFCAKACAEICDNNLDDDGDGLVDCYDPDCCGEEYCLSFYYSECPIDCIDENPSITFEIELEWETNIEVSWCMENTPITADVDGDGLPEIIGKPCGNATNSAAEYPNLLIINGQTGAQKGLILTEGLSNFMDAPAIADMNRNGYAEIVVQTKNGALFCYEYNGTDYVEIWQSTENTNRANVSIADFNQDGIPEVYVGRLIYNGLTGEVLVTLPSVPTRFTIAADVLPDYACVDCKGLELVTGLKVYSIRIDRDILGNGLATLVSSVGKHGLTSLADMDNDKDLDAVVVIADSVLIWDIQTPELLTSIYVSNDSPSSLSCLADFDGDGQVEIGLASPFNYRVLKVVDGNINVLWEISTADWSGETGSTVFDFNLDEQNEVIFRDEQSLKILDGASGLILYEEPCQSATRLEVPVVVDVDNDGEAEILCSCKRKLRSYGSAGDPWVRTRSIWNQHLYFNVNINDDLTVPRNQQQHQLVADGVLFNKFLNQYGDPRFPVPDATIRVDSSYCENDQLQVVLEICNQGENTLSSDTPISIYDHDPTTGAADILVSGMLSDNLVVGACETLILEIPEAWNDSIFCVVNDNGSFDRPYSLEFQFPNTRIKECDYLNNLTGYFPDNLELILDLGEDIEICQNGVAQLDAGEGFDRYLWSDGSTDQFTTALDTGFYFVKTWIACREQFDTLKVFVGTENIFNIGPDTMICKGDTLLLEMTGFEKYQWLPSDFVDCDTCAQVQFIPDTAMFFIGIATNAIGCLSIDTIYVNFDFIDQQDTLYLCNGDTIVFNNSLVGTDEIFIDTIWADMVCDTIITTTILELEALALSIEGVISCNDRPTGIGVTTVSGGLPPYDYKWDLETENVAIADSLPPGMYQLTVTDDNGCSILGEVLILEVDVPFVELLAFSATCFGEADGSIEIIPTLTDSMYRIDQGEFQSENFFTELSAGDYTLYTMMQNSCISEQYFTIEEPNEIQVALTENDTINLGESIDLKVFSSIANTATYIWTPVESLSCIDCDRVKASPVENTVYEVVLTDDIGCTQSDSVQVTVLKIRDIYFPNVFSPNFDGLNDVLEIYPNISVKEILHWQIFNRWGALVFEGHGFQPRELVFDGSFKGEALPSGVYVYWAEIEFLDGVRKKYSGDITLLR